MSKFGKFRELVKVFAPLVLVLVPGGQKIAPIVEHVTEAIAAAEQIPGATGAEKKAHVLAIAKEAAETINATGKAHIDPDEAVAIASHGIDTVIITVKAVEKSRPVTPSTGG